MAVTEVIERDDAPSALDGGEYGEGPDRHPVEVLHEYLQAANIADLLESHELNDIGRRSKAEYEIDKNSRSDWEESVQDALKLALQIAETKNYPWPNAANIKYPLMTLAAIQFNARAYPAIVNSGDLVRTKVIGRDDNGEKRKRGDRVAEHMSWQLLEEMTEWEDETDRLLIILPIAGVCFRKTYFDPILGRNCSYLISPLDLVVNDNARDLATVPRISHEFQLYPYEIEERFRSGVYRKAELGLSDGEDEDAPHDFIEQHRTLDLDDDGYAEPYIVTFHKETGSVVRIVANFRPEDVAFNEGGEIARIERTQYFTKYEFMPNPQGKFHGLGFGRLLRPINDAVDTTINQLLDAGHLANVGGGFIGRGARLRGGRQSGRPGEWVPVDVTGAALRDNLVPRPIQEPSLVLFQLLGMLVEAGKDISSVKDVMTGDAQSANQSPTTTLALIEQGMQVFSAIYKRVYRALKDEYAKLYRLNGLYLNPETYFHVLDEQRQVGPEDYADGDFDIVPVSDPATVTNMQKLGRAEFLLQFRGDPLMRGDEIMRRVFEAASIDDPDELFVEEAPPDPGLLLKADEIELKKREHAISEAELTLKAERQAFEIAKMKAETIKLLAEAEAAEIGPQIEVYKAQLQRLVAQERQIGSVDQGTVRGVEGR